MVHLIAFTKDFQVYVRCDLMCVDGINPDFVLFQVPVVSGHCVLSVEGLIPNQKYVFAVAAYDSQGKLLGNTIGATTSPLLASMPVPLLSTWAHFAQVHICLLNVTAPLHHMCHLWGSGKAG